MRHDLQSMGVKNGILASSQSKALILNSVYDPGPRPLLHPISFFYLQMISYKMY